MLILYSGYAIKLKYFNFAVFIIVKHMSSLYVIFVRGNIFVTSLRYVLKNLIIVEYYKILKSEKGSLYLNKISDVNVICEVCQMTE